MKLDRAIRMLKRNGQNFRQSGNKTWQAEVNGWTIEISECGFPGQVGVPIIIDPTTGRKWFHRKNMLVGAIRHCQKNPPESQTE